MTRAPGARARRRRGRPRRPGDEAGRQADRVSQSVARSPSTMAAVAAVLASTHVPATTVAVRHGPGRQTRGGVHDVMSDARRPSSGGRSCSRSPSRRRRSRSLRLGASGACALSSAPATRQPPIGGGPAVARSPPRLTRTPQPERGRRRLRPGPRRAPCRSSRGRARRRAGRGRSGRRGRGGSCASRGPRSTTNVTGAVAGEVGEVAVVAERRSAPPTVGSTAPSVIRAARDATPMAWKSSGLTRMARSGCSWSRSSSLSGRNRL